LIEAVRILTTTGQKVNQLLSGQTYRCAYQIHFTRDATNVRCAMLIKTSAGMDLGGAMSAPVPAGGIPNISQGSTADMEFEFNCTLNPGIYHLSVAVFGSMAGMEYALHGITGAEVFRVVADAKHLAIGNVDFGCRAAVKVVDPEAQ
jgi:lipopolysaccharide transport system ATP-binding protein